MDNRSFLYDLIYALAARDGREPKLFGSSAPYARVAFERSLALDGFPELWFELPLAGEPWFDLHALASREQLASVSSFAPETCGNCPEAFAWFAAQKTGAAQLALSWDTGAGNVERPAVQLLTKTGNVAVTCAFLEAVGRPDAAESFRAFSERIDNDWCACYAGVFPQRQTPHLRVECIPSQGLQEAYAKDPALLGQHLRQVGFSAFGDTLLERCLLLARSPFRMEFQFDVMPGGVAGATLGVSIRFSQPPGTNSAPAFEEQGAAGSILRKLEAWGLSDERWRLLPATSFAKRATRDGSSALLYCYPAFVKLRWRGGQPLDAKAYLMAGIQ